MSDAYLSEIRLFGFPFPPSGWALCDGSLLSIAQNQALFSLLGTTYGGDGTTTFALPDLRGRVPLHTSAQIGLGAGGDEEGHVLTVAEVPAHNHALPASAQTGNSSVPTGNVVAAAEAGQQFMSSAEPDQYMAPDAISNAGEGRPHNNMQPFLCVNFCMCVQGYLPPRG